MCRQNSPCSICHQKSLLQLETTPWPPLHPKQPPLLQPINASFKPQNPKSSSSARKPLNPSNYRPHYPLKDPKNTYLASNCTPQNPSIKPFKTPQNIYQHQYRSPQSPQLKPAKRHGNFPISNGYPLTWRQGLPKIFPNTSGLGFNENSLGYGTDILCNPHP